MKLAAALEKFQDEYPRYVQAFVILLTAIVSLIAVFNMQIVDHDTSWFRGHFMDFYNLEYEYFTGDPAELDLDQGWPSMINLPYAPLLMPLVLNMHWASFWVAFSTMLVVTGDKRELIPSITRLLFLASPFLFYSFSAANLIAATAFGLLIFFTRPKGILRGITWALFMIRPQDTFPWLLYDGVMALRDRDWRAFATTAVIMTFPIFFYGPGIYFDWVQTMLAYSSAEARPSFALVNFGLVYGTPIAIVIALAVGALRFIGWRDGGFKLRSWKMMPYVEQLWLMCMVYYIAQPYGTYTMLWLIVFGIRLFPPARALIAYALLLSAGLYGFFTVDPVRAVWGVVLSIAVMAILMPRNWHPLDPEQVTADGKPRPAQ